MREVLAYSLAHLIFFYSAIALYFYNLIHDTQKQKKNLAIRLMLVGLIPSIYQILTTSFFDTLLRSFAIGLICFLPIPLFILICLFKRVKILNPYFYHLCLICGYCLIAFCIDAIFYRSANAMQSSLAFLTTPSIFLFLGLMLLWIFGLLLYFTSWIKTHDFLCLLWSFCVMMTFIFNHPIFIFFYHMGLELSESNLWALVFSSASILTAMILFIFFHHSFYFLRLLAREKRGG